MSFIRFCKMNERTNISISPLSPSSNTLSLHNTWNPFITCKYCGAWLDTVEPRKPCKNSRINSHALPGTTQGLYSTYSTQTDKNKEGNNFTHRESCTREIKWKFFRKIRDLSFSRTNYLIQFKLEKRAHGNNRQNCKRDSIESLVPRRRAVGHVRYEESMSSNDFRFGAHTSTIAFLVRPTCSASNSLIETACDYQITYTLHVLIYRRWKRGISILISLSLMQT